MASRAERAKQRLIRALRLAYSGELAAAQAYAGHWRSVRDPRQRAGIRRIRAEELAHRAHVGVLLRELGAHPSQIRDAAMWCLGTLIGASCFAGGWYLPMYGAGRLERRNIGEYEDAARLALEAHAMGMTEPLLGMAEVEWDPERYFHDHVRTHPLHRRTGSWPDPKPRAEIRRAFGKACVRPRPPRPPRLAPQPAPAPPTR